MSECFINNVYLNWNLCFKLEECMREYNTVYINVHFMSIKKSDHFVNAFLIWAYSDQHLLFVSKEKTKELEKVINVYK